MRPTVQTERVLNKSAMGRDVAGGRERLASGVAAIAGRKRAIARWKMSSRDPIRCPEDLCVCAATVRGARNRKRRGREREREGQHGARCIGRRTNLCRCHANVRIRSLSTCVHVADSIRRRKELRSRDFFSNFYTQ